ncbi:hypothetical protein [Roseomonas genomospecies 6]|uniref:Uncharacterized protein n=1 Tax=Roseomonas genomospecies 6 TaxID=214106 RepID=A0A9W7NI63_9PROT|nr:hypothetical protein [Roseomonas genomospecies 6]KAA0679437.1 hypothetical protein DS843_15955 [Roseomonas genomospecies 6]
MAIKTAIVRAERVILEPLTALLSLYGAYTNVKKPAAIGAIEIATAKVAETLTVGAVGVTVTLDAPVPNWALNLPHRPPALLQTEPATAPSGGIPAVTPSPSPTPAPHGVQHQSGAGPSADDLVVPRGRWLERTEFL